MPIEPDSKDWTWVLERPCPECGFDASTFPAAGVAALIRSNAVAWERLLWAVDDLRRRPGDGRWSTLEYACQSAMSAASMTNASNSCSTTTIPLMPTGTRTPPRPEDDYNAQDPSTVATELRSAAHGLAEAFDQVEGAQWQRTGRRSDGARFTVDSFSRYLVHDPVHHLFDVTGERVSTPDSCEPPSLLTRAGQLVRFVRQPGRVGFEVDRGVVDRAQRRGRTAGGERCGQGGSYRLGLACLGDDGQHLARPGAAPGWSPYGLGRDASTVGEVTLVDLLRPARLVELDHLDVERVVKSATRGR